MSPVERTAAWVLNNGQYEEEQQEAQEEEQRSTNTEKVKPAQMFAGVTKASFVHEVGLVFTLVSFSSEKKMFIFNKKSK